MDVDVEMDHHNMGFLVEFSQNEDRYRVYDTPEGSVANAAAQKDSGVRARWVELPNCDAGVNDSNPLDADLHNASKATCKTPEIEIRAIPPALAQNLPPGVPPDEGA